MEGRIRQIESFLEDVEIVPPTPEGVVGLGTIVAIVYEGDSEDAAEHYLIGHVEEKPDEDHISVMSPSSPLGSALLGATVGATVSYDAPNGKLQVTVLLTRTQG
jgi:transcription elongation factor GreA